MSCCCIKTLNLCNVPVCGVLEINQAATEESGVANVYTLVLDFLETTVTLMQEQTGGENIKFNVGKLNENFQYIGQIFDAAGEKISIEVGEESYDCIKFKTIINLFAETQTAVPPVLAIPDTVVIEAVVDDEPTVTGTTETVTGLTDGSTTVISNAFIGVRVIIIRGNIPIPGIDPLDGSNYFTKTLGSDTITFSKPLVPGEFIRIQTIPQ